MNKVPDLRSPQTAGVHSWTGATARLKRAAREAELTYHELSLSDAHDKETLMRLLQTELKLPPHFGQNFDALADCLMDDDWAHGRGNVIVLRDSARFANEPSGEASLRVLREVLTRVGEYWNQRGKPFWAFIA